MFIFYFCASNESGYKGPKERGLPFLGEPGLTIASKLCNGSMSLSAWDLIEQNIMEAVPSQPHSVGGEVDHSGDAIDWKKDDSNLCTTKLSASEDSQHRAVCSTYQKEEKIQKKHRKIMIFISMPVVMSARKCNRKYSP